MDRDRWTATKRRQQMSSFYETKQINNLLYSVITVTFGWYFKGQAGGSTGGSKTLLTPNSLFLVFFSSMSINSVFAQCHPMWPIRQFDSEDFEDGIAG